jgi:hypothetical protein
MSAPPTTTWAVTNAERSTDLGTIGLPAAGACERCDREGPALEPVTTLGGFTNDADGVVLTLVR